MPQPNHQLRKMRLFATGLLVLMMILYVLARSFEVTVPAWSWVRAFAEAATVGALADWFAVTALFRHPLGLPIPHTAIVKKEQKRIGASVASFMHKSFLTPFEVTRQWLSWRPLTRLLKHLQNEENSKQLIRLGLAKIPKALGPEDRQTLAGIGASAIRHGAGTIPIGRLVTILLQGFLNSPGRRGLIAPILGRLGQSVAENREWVMDEAARSTKPKKLKVFDLMSRVAASAVSGKAVEKFSSELIAASKDESHPLYQKIEDALADTAIELESGDQTQWETLKARILDEPGTKKVVEETVEKAARLVVESASNLEESNSLNDWAAKLSETARRFSEDPEKLEAGEKRAADLVARFSKRFAPGVEKLISRTVAGWEATELIDRLENQVGADLQFIRINGTLIGGLVGVVLHSVGLLIW